MFPKKVPCTRSCRCTNCANTQGKITTKPLNTRKRQHHIWQGKLDNSTNALLKMREKIDFGARTSLEYLLVANILAHCQQKVSTQFMVMCLIYYNHLECLNLKSYIASL